MYLYSFPTRIAGRSLTTETRTRISRGVGDVTGCVEGPADGGNERRKVKLSRCPLVLVITLPASTLICPSWSSKMEQ